MEKLDAVASQQGPCLILYVVGSSIHPSMEEVQKGVCLSVTPGTRLGDILEEIKFKNGGGEMFRLSVQPIPSWRPADDVSAYECETGDILYFNLRPAAARDTSAILKSSFNTSKRLRREHAVTDLKPRVVERDVLLGTPDDVLVSLRWLALVVEHDGLKVELDTLRAHRLEFKQKKRRSVPEADYYPGALAFLNAAAYGQSGLIYRGQGYRRCDIQGMVQKPGETKPLLRCPVEVKVAFHGATDRDPDGADANALEIKDVVDAIEGDDPVNLGILLVRMDRFWVVKHDRQQAETLVTPYFSRAQSPMDTPHSDAAFELVNMRDVDAGKGTLADALPTRATSGFKTLVAFVEELRKLHGLEEAQVSFCSATESSRLPISISDLSVLAYGRNSLVLLKRSSSSVLKVCQDVGAEVNIHYDTDGHENLRKLLGWGFVNIGNVKVFEHVELEGFGEPFSAKHLTTTIAMATMWQQARAGLRHLHQKGVFHRDLKPDNMIVFGGGVLKINDYDLSCYMAEEDGRYLVGTPGYQSPSSLCPYKEEDDILSLALAFHGAKEGQTPPLEQVGRILTLKSIASRTDYPVELKDDVDQALRNLGL